MYKVNKYIHFTAIKADNKDLHRFDYNVSIKLPYPFVPVYNYQLKNVTRSDLLRSIIEHLNDALVEASTLPISFVYTTAAISQLTKCIEETEWICKLYGVKIENENVVCNCCNQTIKDDLSEDRWGGYICSTCSKQES